MNTDSVETLGRELWTIDGRRTRLGALLTDEIEEIIEN